MNTMYRLYCRTYQGVFRLVAPLLPFREPQVLRGKGSLGRLPGLLREKGLDRVLVVTDAGLVKIGLAAPLLQILAAQGIETALYDGTVPNPTIDNVEAAVAIYREHGCQAIIALGGGSPMDVAKAVGARISHPRMPVSRMRGVLKLHRPLPPLFVIPTTAGTGSEATLAAVITDSATHEKRAINDPRLIPRWAVLDPELTVNLPKPVTSTTGMDALTHAVEAYIGGSNTRKTEKMALGAVRLIAENLRKAYADGTDLAARENMQEAAYMAGVAFTRAYVGYVHALAHTLGGMYHVPHGLANAVLLPHVLEAYGETAWKRLAPLADAAGISAPADPDAEKAKKFIAWIREMNAAMGIPDKLAGTFREEDIPLLTRRAEREGNPLYPVPKIMGADELAPILRKIM